MLAVPVARRMPAFRHGLARALLAIWLLAGASDALSAQDQTDVHRVLVVYENESTQAAAVAIGRGLHERLNAQAPTKFEIYSEYLDNVRFPEPENQERLAAHFAAKYVHVNIDVAIALGPNALKFLLDRRDQILRGAPLVFGAVSKDILTSTSFPENATGVVSQHDAAKTIELARRLQPDAERIVVISGSGAFDRSWEESAREAPSAWDQFRNEILLVIAVMALQAAMIAALVAQARRRRNAEQELAIQRRELAHFSRTSVLGELSGALAHELNQPLTSILANAEAGARLLEEEPADKQEIKEILSDIVAEDKRAAAVIAQLRRLMLKGETDRERVDLDQVVGATSGASG